MKLAAIYARVSTTNLGQDTKRQVDELKSIAKEKGYDVHDEDIYQDYVSGYSKIDAREHLNNLVERIKSENGSKYDAIFISEISRLARDPNQGRELVNFFTEKNICLHVKNPRLESITNDKIANPIFNIIFTILLEFANAEAIQTKQRQKSGIRAKARKGEFIGGANINYGYKSEKSLIVIDDKESPIVKKIFDLCNSGCGTKKIANYLNDNGIKTRVSGKSKGIMIKQKNNLPPVNSDNIKWSEGTVYGILTNNIYYGKKRYNYDDSSPTDSETLEKNGKNFYLVDVPNIIDKETFDKAQLELKGRLRHSIRNTKFTYILKDVLKCGVCGGNYCGRRRSDGTDSFYFCRTSETKTRECDNLGIGIEIIESSIWTAIVDTKFVEQLILNQTMNIEKVEKEMLDKESDIKNLNIEIKRFEKITEKWRIEYFEERIEETEYLAGRKPHDSRIKTNKERIIETNNSIKNLEKVLESKNSLDNLIALKNSLESDRLKIKEIITESFQRVAIRVLDKKFAIFSIVLKSNLREEVSFLLNRKEKYLIGFNYQSEFYNPNGALEWDSYGRLLTTIEDVYSNIHHLDYFDDIGVKKELKWIKFQ